MMVIDGADKVPHHQLCVLTPLDHLARLFVQAKVTEQIHNAMEKSKTYKKRSSTVDARANGNEVREQRMSVDGTFAGKQAGKEGGGSRRGCSLGCCDVVTRPQHFASSSPALYSRSFSVHPPPPLPPLYHVPASARTSHVTHLPAPHQGGFRLQLGCGLFGV
jgi:hypothetical protein